MPVVLTTVETKCFSGNMWPQLRAVFPGQEPIERSSMNSWDDKNFVAAIEKSGRKKILLAGLWTEICVALPTVQAIHDGYEIYVVEDCCGDVSQLAHDNAMQRVIQAGAKPVTAMSAMLEWQRDWAQRGHLRCRHGHREEPLTVHTGSASSTPTPWCTVRRPRNFPSTRFPLPLQPTSKI